MRKFGFYLIVWSKSSIFIYRVSINSFPDYKHLLQENYVDYKRVHMLKCTNAL